MCLYTKVRHYFIVFCSGYCNTEQRQKSRYRCHAAAAADAATLAEAAAETAMILHCCCCFELDRRQRLSKAGSHIVRLLFFLLLFNDCIFFLDNNHWRLPSGYTSRSSLKLKVKSRKGKKYIQTKNFKADSVHALELIGFVCGTGSSPGAFDTQCYGISRMLPHVCVYVDIRTYICLYVCIHVWRAFVRICLMLVSVRWKFMRHSKQKKLNEYEIQSVVPLLTLGCRGIFQRFSTSALPENQLPLANNCQQGAVAQGVERRALSARRGLWVDADNASGVALRSKRSTRDAYWYCCQDSYASLHSHTHQHTHTHTNTFSHINLSCCKRISLLLHCSCWLFCPLSFGPANILWHLCLLIANQRMPLSVSGYLPSH